MFSLPLSMRSLSLSHDATLCRLYSLSHLYYHFCPSLISTAISAPLSHLYCHFRPSLSHQYCSLSPLMPFPPLSLSSLLSFPPPPPPPPPPPLCTLSISLKLDLLSQFLSSLPPSTELFVQRMLEETL
ncbi:hypothetical protein AMTRI_Chr08g164040 [Amborella trichopoda]